MPAARTRRHSSPARARLIFKRMGGSIGARFPKPITDAAKIRVNGEAVIEVRADGAIVLVPVVSKRKRWTVKELMEGVTPENVHKVEWGPNRGKEII